MHSHTRLLAALAIVVAPLAGCTSGPSLPPGGPDLPDLPEIPDLSGMPGDQTDERPPVPDGNWLSTTPTATERPVPGANLTVEFIDVGQGDAVVLHFPDAVVVWDAGRWTEDSYGALLDHVASDGVRTARAFVLSHPDADHAGGCAPVFGALDVELFVHPGSTKDTRTWERCAAAALDEGGTILSDATVDPGHFLNLSRFADVQVLHLDDGTEDVNDGSVVLRIVYGDVSFVFPGDASCDVEERIISLGFEVDADVLMVGHHGSRTSTCDAWLDAVAPAVGVVSVGFNPYGHPTPETLDRLAAHGVLVYRTDQHGDVTVTSDGTGWDVRTARGGTPDAADAGALPVAADGASGVSIDRVHADAAGNDHENLNDEWVRVINAGHGTADLSNWTLEDDAGHVYTFPAGFGLAAGAAVRIHTGSDTDTATDLYWGADGAVWNNDGDVATLRDASGSVVSIHAYP